MRWDDPGHVSLTMFLDFLEVWKTQKQRRLRKVPRLDSLQLLVSRESLAGAEPACFKICNPDISGWTHSNMDPGGIEPGHVSQTTSFLDFLGREKLKNNVVWEKCPGSIPST